MMVTTHPYAPNPLPPALAKALANLAQRRGTDPAVEVRRAVEAALRAAAMWPVRAKGVG